MSRTSTHPTLKRAALTLLFATVLPIAGFAEQPPKIQIASGAEQQTTYQAAFPAPVSVWVATETHRPLEGVAVRFTASSGLALSASVATTDSLGLASVNVTGLALGHHTVRAEIVGHPGEAVTFDSLFVDKAVLTIVPGDHFSAVGSIPAMADYTIRGFVNGETPETAYVTGSAVLTTAATNQSPDANYAIKGGVGTLRADNYRFVPGFGTLVLSGGSQSSAAEDTALYDADGNRITLSDANETANAVRRAFLDQQLAASTVPLAPAHVQASGVFSLRAELRQTTPSGEVKAAANLIKSQTAPGPVTRGQVKAVASLIKPGSRDTQAGIKAGSASIRGALAATPLAPIASAISAGSVKAVTQLVVQAAPIEASAPGTIRGSLLPATH